ncbi:mucin-5AC-like isoform X12 [Oncorhynchus keta]|uniref:mucin-5AC-like isoform X12 n=1 Tax=Oncorhynchus keta TaxID=8018 RepID=UPI00227BF8D3|nr:mucin-5AC-like isoform X12 [Oncorhynchus keta]
MERFNLFQQIEFSSHAPICTQCQLAEAVQRELNGESGKVGFTETSLNSTSITTKNVTWAEEVCYICSFNVYPSGSRRKQTCLTVQELYGPSLLVTQTNNSHTTLSCSATGRPVPIVTWDDIMIEHSTMVDVTHPNGTVTMTTTVTVVVSSLTDKEVRCVASMSFSDVTKNVSMVIPASITGQSQVSDDDRISGTVVGAVMGAVLCLMCLIAVFCVIWRQKRRKDTSSRKPPVPDPEISRTPLKTPPTSKQSQSSTSTPNNSTTSSLNNSTTSSPNNSTTKRRMTKNSSDKLRMQQAQEAVKKNLFNDY